MIKKDKNNQKNSLCSEKEEEYYRAIKRNGAFDDNYIEYQSKQNEDKILSIKEYLNIFKPYLTNIKPYNNIINDHKEEWKIQLMMKINFFTAMEPIKICHEMYRRSKNIMILTSHAKDEI